MPRALSRSRTDPVAAGSTRRIATVVSSVPEATSARSSTSRLGMPPVPMISREVNVSPARMNGSSIGLASLHGGDDLDLIAIGQLRLGPGGPADDFAVDGRRDPGGRRGQQRDGFSQ